MVTGKLNKRSIFFSFILRDWFNYLRYLTGYENGMECPVNYSKITAERGLERWVYEHSWDIKQQMVKYQDGEKKKVH